MNKVEGPAKHKMYKVFCVCDPGQREFGANHSESFICYSVNKIKLVG